MAGINEELYQCAIANNVHEMEKLLCQGADMNYKKNGEILLMATTRYGSFKAVKFLVKNGADINELYDGKSALSVAVIKAHYSQATMKVLLESGADVNLLNEYGEFPLYIASECGNVKAVKLLLKHGAQVNLQLHDSGESSLMRAGDKVVKLLLKHGAETDLQDKGGMSALMHATHSHYKRSIELLIKNGASVDLQDEDGSTALIHAAIAGHKYAAEQLLKHNSKVDVVDKRGRSSLCIEGMIDMVSLLLEYRANVNLQDNGDSALMHSVRKGHHEVAEILEHKWTYKIVRGGQH
jgi:ankyrin repeat protein